ncbi:MAG: YXWGXW repeat-containing protein [Labilithrix sp.]|nr:YXWGXW repeat-containing protein [Labilithrix sp.]
MERSLPRSPAMRLPAALFSTMAIVAAILACGSGRLPSPPFTRQPTSALHVVPYPAPPARVELVPHAPRERGAVWIDGEWVWQGRRWAWRAGRWVIAPEGAAFSPWTSVRDLDGTLYVAEGKWRDRHGREIPDPKALAEGEVNAGAVVSPENEAVPTGPTFTTPSDAGEAEERPASEPSPKMVAP